MSVAAVREIHAKASYRQSYAMAPHIAYTVHECRSCRTSWPCPTIRALDAVTCHCGQPVTFGYDGDPTHRRGMCERCDSLRCDAYPGTCERQR